MKKILIVIFLLYSQVQAVEPDEILADQKLENVARLIGKELRCLVCQNEDIENSNADMARDLRVLVRKMLSEGKTKDEIVSYIHSRYGDFVLFNPPVRYDTLLLWLLPIIFLILLSYTFFRKKH
ncbi:MAG: cytochrome c-type biogenesis protein CcmH [Rickettsiales bacterium]|nr:cytochrome c-type biogenesis protein CcmH [Rickettsiales bacterium]RPG15524.1 MAG: cytochrome c-type biogenesis protein CcmH [Pelagibacteraceae bacterium TMED195]|tara:strand:- start:679 stop:1050 length:372 start_codon:yes stop_codon:yes gene_type:complete